MTSHGPHRMFSYGTLHQENVQQALYGRKGDAQDKVIGAYLQLTDEELATTDDYEVEDYSRILVTLASGVEAFVYVAAGLR